MKTPVIVVLSLLLEQAGAQLRAPFPSQFCYIVAGEGVSLATIRGIDPLRKHLILHALRYCPAEFAATADMFPSRMLLEGLAGFQPGNALTAALLKDAAAKLKATPYHDSSEFARAFTAGPAKYVNGTASALALLRAEQRESQHLAQLAAEQKGRTGDKNKVLMSGIFILWLVNRNEVNSAFQPSVAAVAWLEPYPPSYVFVGPNGDTTLWEGLAASIVDRASQGIGPIDRWFRRFKLEH